jgi:DNA-binding transcriptional ArsR family regulator
VAEGTILGAEMRSASVVEVRSQPPIEQLEIGVVFGALSDPLRRRIIAQLLADPDDMPRRCSTFDYGVSKSTMTHHFKVLREAGLISAVDYGNRCEITLRRSDVDFRFPGLLTLLS